MTEMVFEIAEPSNMAAWVMATIAALLLILGLLLGWLALSFGHPSVVLTDEDLRLNAPLYGTTIPNAEIAVNQARIVDLNNEPQLTPPDSEQMVLGCPDTGSAGSDSGMATGHLQR